MIADAFPSLFLLSIAAVVSLIVVPLRYFDVKPNNWYGVRSAESFRSPESWRLINRYAARMVFRWALTFVALAAVLMLPLGLDPRISTAVALLYPLTVFVPMLVTSRYARGLPKELGDGGPRSKPEVRP